ncbi:hypothetical protein [Streptomyces oceani]|uniref:Ferredoxin n=1 Tax=Streptomyces oceani TaxID=1075402 RepID=A0A1E7KKY0_9ACTN|nr:hypothetical protein [Streptomyces oceani]OEV04544.1 hypothetical protein AN216_06450 [Streptomyces oceani]
MAPRTDNRLLDSPMRPVVCRACGARVAARKSSWEQTSVQWDSEALSACAERRLLPSGSRSGVGGPGSSGSGISGPDPGGPGFRGCRALAATIREAAAAGEIPVREELPADG